ncbi:transposase, partial [Streptomyces sp. NPDC002790]|uniref:transposase n=1 Tax=Streptomyces sp. NPDC002790 TaxID=3154431 RepID=UPI00331D16E8
GDLAQPGPLGGLLGLGDQFLRQLGGLRERRPKGVSSRRLRPEFPDLVRHYWRANKLWSSSYFAGTVGGAPLSVVRQYIEQQNRPV